MWLKKSMRKKQKILSKQYKNLKSKQKQDYQSNKDNIIMKINSKIILLIKIMPK